MRAGRDVAQQRRRHADGRQDEGRADLQGGVERPRRLRRPPNGVGRLLVGGLEGGDQRRQHGRRQAGGQRQQHHRHGDGDGRLRQLDEDLAQHLFHRFQREPGQAVAKRQPQHGAGQPQQRRLADEQPGDLARVAPTERRMPMSWRRSATLTDRAL